MFKMLNRKGSTKGFTLLEVLIVLVILAVLAGLAIPAYQAAVEKSRSQEALASLAAAREAMMRYFAVNNTYADVPATGNVIAADMSTGVDYNPNTGVGGQTPIFSYTVGGRGAAAFVITATRIGGGAAAGSTITIDQSGRITRGGVYA